MIDIIVGTLLFISAIIVYIVGWYNFTKDLKK